MHVLEGLQLRFPVLLSSHLPDLCAVLLSSRLVRHSTQMHTKPLNLLWLLGQVRSSSGQGFHQPQLSQSVAQHSPPPRIPGHPGPIVRFCGRNFLDDPSRRQSPAHVGSCLVSKNVTSSENFSLSALHELPPTLIHARRLSEVPATWLSRTTNDGRRQGARSHLHPRDQSLEGSFQLHLNWMMRTDP